MPINLKNWLRDRRGKRPEEVYIEFSKVPEESEGPYRARLATAAHERGVQGIDVTEREVVSGELHVLYRTHCPCGHQWETSRFQRMSICPKCDRAVLLEVPKLPTE
jgi:hypothetical protein